MMPRSAQAGAVRANAGSTPPGNKTVAQASERAAREGRRGGGAKAGMGDPSGLQGSPRLPGAGENRVNGASPAQHRRSLAVGNAFGPSNRDNQTPGDES
jgi:hypothetical protein